MLSFTNTCDRPAKMTRTVLEASFAPWGGSRICTDAYESSIQAMADLHLTVAKTVRLEPVSSFATTWADATRDIGAAQLSAARWYLDA